MRGFKNDQLARETWGDELYARIPKSVFAYIAWHLANAASDSSDRPGYAADRFAQEWAALESHGINPMPEKIAAALRAARQAEDAKAST